MTTPALKHPHDLKLGARRPKVIPHQPYFNRCSALIAPRAPLALPRHDVHPAYQMFDNDQIGDCSSAGIANTMISFSALSNTTPIITTNDAVNFYSLSTGYNPADPSTDQGGVLSEVLAYAVVNGYTAGYYKYFPLWGTLDPHDRNALGNGINMFGSVYCGFGLAQADYTTVGEVWDTETPGDQTGWSWGGHCALLFAYEGLADTDIVYIATWGGLQKATWRWVHARIFESHVVAFRDLMPASGQTLIGQTWDELAAVTRQFQSCVSQ